MTDGGVSIFKRLLWISNIIFHQVAAILVIYIWSTIFGNYDINSFDTWHVILTSVGFLLLICEGLNLFFEHNLFTLYLPRTKKGPVHGALMALSAILITTGISFKIARKSSDHFTSTHAILGLCSLILLWLSVCFGIFTSNAKRFKDKIPPVWIKFVHNLIGIATLCLGISTLGLGMYKDFAFKILTSDRTLEAAVATMGIFVAWSLVPACISIFHQFKTIIHK